ncbi:hypothetical protein N9341_02775 [Candidatus Pelagibacter sp.]|nr:hypothetical protein [Candidatus Pelagibacter sp.]
MIKNNNLKKIIFIILISLISFYVNFYFGHQGLMPLDDLQNFNSGHRILKGDFPFRDYYSITGPILDIWQSYFYKIFGSNWQSLIIHASTLNCIYSLSIFFFLNRLNIKQIDSFFFSISAGLLMYPPAGSPTVEHSSLILSTIAFFYFIIGLKEKNNLFLILSIIIFTISFFTKQVPTAYFVILSIIIYFSQIFNKINIFNFILLIISSLFSVLFIIIYFKFNDVLLSEIYNQYFLIASSLGENRFSNLNFDIFYNKISKIFFVLFLIIPTLYLSLVKRKISSFLVIFGISLILIIYEIHSNNQPITFGLLPVTIALFYYFHIDENLNSSFIRYFFWLITTYCFYRILRFEINYLIIFVLIIFFEFRKNISLRYLIIIYLFISSCFYFEKYVKIRSWDDLNKDDLKSSFDAGIIDKKLKNLKWKTVYFKNPDLEKKLIFETLDYLKSLDEDVNYLLITEYQIYNLILDQKDYSPVKYWHLNASYPSKNHPQRNNFEIFFKKKITENKINQIIIDNTAGFKSNNLDEFKWLNKCVVRIDIPNHNYIDIFNIKKNCLN